MHGLVFGALIASTDPIAVVGLFKSLGAPKRLAVLVEGESLLNDGTAVVLFTLILGIAQGQEVSTGAAVLDFVKVVGMGVLIGVAMGFAVSKVIQRVEEPMIEITLTTIAAYGSFVAAEQLHYSGVIATVTAGMICGNYAVRTGMGPTTRIAVESFWEYVAFALNSIVFLLIGFEVHVRIRLEGGVREDILRDLRAEYVGQAEDAEVKIQGLQLRAAELLEEERDAARRHVLLVEKDAILAAHAKGLIGQEAMETLLADVDARLFRLEAGQEAQSDADPRAAEQSPRGEA